MLREFFVEILTVSIVWITVFVARWGVRYVLDLTMPSEYIPQDVLELLRYLNAVVWICIAVGYSIVSIYKIWHLVKSIIRAVRGK